MGWISRFFFAQLLALAALGQQYPFVPITGPDAPKGASLLFEDSRGGLWAAGAEASAEGLRYFDGSRFSTPVKDFPGVLVHGMAEDSAGGILMATTGGYLRVYRGRIERIAEGASFVSLASVGPDVFLGVLAPPNTNPVTDSALVRIERAPRGWRVDVLLKPMGVVQLRTDRSGHVLFGCLGGYCELESADAVGWRAGTVLPVKRHAAPTGIGYAGDRALVLRDRFGCVWMRSTTDVSFQCPGDTRPQTLPSSTVTIGAASMGELADGTMVLPSFSKLALGRPGKFRVISAVNGFPSTGYILCTRDGSIWLSNANGIFVVPSRLHMEFWTQRDGLDGNTWSILPVDGKVFAIAGDTLSLLDSDRARWRPLVRLNQPLSLLPGPDHTLLVGSRKDGVLELSEAGALLHKSQPMPVNLLTRSGDKRFWAAGSSLGEVVFGPQGETLKPLVTKPLTSGPRLGTVSDMAFDKNQTLWFCSAQGLKYEREGNWHELAQRQSLLENACEFSVFDRDGGLWIAYITANAFSLIENPEARQPRFLHFRNGADIGNAHANFFASDSRGWLWRGASDGVYVADLAQARHGEWLHLNRSDGLPAIDTNQHDFKEDKDGSVWFGADDAVIHLFPTPDLVSPGYAPKVFLAGISEGAEEIPTGAAQNRVEGDVKSGQDLTAHLGSLQFDRRNALQTRYRLLPGQSTWRVSHDLDLPLGRPAWGKHRLEVQARLGEGPWSAIEQASITVLKPVWLGWPLVSGVVLLAALIAGGGHRFRQIRATRARKTFPELAEWRLAAIFPEEQRLKGKLLDSRFEVGRPLAQGGFAWVAEGRDRERGGARCAIKIFHHDVADKVWLARRFRQEVSALEKVCHPNVVRIYGSGRSPEGTQYLAMEFVEGKTLREKLEEGRFTRRQTASYLRQIGQALDAIHARDICHRDLKPENLMLRSAAEPGCEVVLIDFSIAILKDPEETLHGLSRAAGTLHYMAPEQAIGYADPSTDIYSLAKILIEMLAGERLSTLLPNASLDLPARVRELLSGAEYSLSPVSIASLAAALEFDPARRPQNAGLFAETIAREIEPRTIGAH